MRKFGRTSQNIRFAGKTEYTHPTRGRERLPPEERAAGATLVAAVRATAAGETHIAPSIVERMVSEFVRRPPPGSSRPAALDELTDSEIEVLKLVARGLTNAEIANALFLGEATVRTHVSRIPGKLGLRDRTQAAVVAYESGLVEPGREA